MYAASRALARARIFAARHAWLRWTVVAVLASTAGLIAQRELAAVDAERKAWGDTVDVVVATADLTPDGALTVATRSVPTALAPSGALTELPDGSRLRQRVMNGEILTSADITLAAGPAAGAEPGTAVVGVADALAPGPEIGLQVAVTAEGVTLADEATIVSIVGDVVYVAVPVAEAPMVAAAAQAGLASLLYLP